MSLFFESDALQYDLFQMFSHENLMKYQTLFSSTNYPCIGIIVSTEISINKHKDIILKHSSHNFWCKLDFNGPLKCTRRIRRRHVGHAIANSFAGKILGLPYWMGCLSQSSSTQGFKNRKNKVYWLTLHVLYCGLHWLPSHHRLRGKFSGPLAKLQLQ